MSIHLGDIVIFCYKGLQALQCQVQSILGHVSKAHSKPTGFRAMARGSGRDIQADLVDNLFPKLHFGFEGVGPEQVPHVHPTEQTGIALEAAYAGFLKPRYKFLLPLSEPLVVL